MKIKKYVIKRILFESLFFMYIASILYISFSWSIPENLKGIFYVIYVIWLGFFILQIATGYWPRLTFDILFFNKKTDTFRVLWHDNISRTKYDLFCSNKFCVVRVKNNKETAFPVEEVIGYWHNDVVKIKYYRLSKVILSCELIKRADSDLCGQGNMVPDPNQK